MPPENIILSPQFLTIHPVIEKWEGGYVDHPRDPGGATNMGITLNTLSAWRERRVTKQEVRALTNKEAREIFKTRYYDKIKGDDLPAPLALAVYNSAVLSGPSRAAKWLQQIINSHGEGIRIDGEIGPITIAATQSLEPNLLAEAYFDRYERFLRALKTWPAFGKGWLNRLDDMRRTAKTLDTASFNEFNPTIIPRPSELTTINNALGPLIGKLLNGRKTGIGIIGLLVIQILPELVPELANGLAIKTKSGSTIWQSALSAILAWGILGKTDKWVKNK